MLTVYSKDNCPNCVQAKRLLDAQTIDYTEVKIGRDMAREDFIMQFPQVRMMPFITINDGRVIGGLKDLHDFISNQEQ